MTLDAGSGVAALALVVDDDRFERVLLREVLEGAGLRVAEASDGGPALRLFEELRPDIVLLDVVMATTDGFTTCAGIRALPGGATVPILMVTGLDDPSSIRQAYDAGATDFITKPLVWPILVQRIRYMLRSERILERLRTSESALNDAQRIARLGSFEAKRGAWRLRTSQQFRAILGARPSVPRPEADELPVREALRRIVPGERRRLFAALRSAATTGRPFYLECRVPAAEPDEPAAAERIVAVRGEAVAGPGGGLMHGTVQDISEFKRLELELRAAKQAADAASHAKTAFLANMSHELRTPLNAILGFAEILAGVGPFRPGKEKTEEYFGLILKSGRHLNDIIADILDMSRIEAGALDLQYEKIDLRQLVQTCIDMVRPQARVAGLDLEVAIATTLPAMSCDATRLRQILLNLLSNAVKFNRPGGTVRIEAGCDTEGRVLVEVSDTGIGMTDEECATALQPFQQIGSWLSRRRDGTGLGLPIAKSLTELLGGRFSIRSTPDVGTRVSFTLPTGPAA